MTPRRLRPAALRSGNRVAITAPASPVVSRPRLQRGLELLRSWGLEPVQMPHLYDRTGFLAGSDADRLADLHEAWADPTIRGVVCARGGYGAQRLTDRIDYELVRRDPKVFVGFSDITGLHAALGRHAGVVTFHGPMGEWNERRTGGVSEESLHRALFDPEPLGILPTGPLRTLHPGVVEGPLAGGNLSLLSASVGTPDEPDFAGALVLLEDVGERPYRIDRMLRQLLRAGLLDGAAGLVFGEFVDCEETRAGRTSFPLTDVITSFVAACGLPAVYGLPAGHGPRQLTVPLGVLARIDAGAGRLEVLHAATR